MRRTRTRVAFASALLLLVIALSLGIQFLLSRLLSPNLIAVHAAQTIGREVRIDAIALSVWPSPRVRLEGVAIEPNIRLEQVEARIRLLPLLQRRVELAGVRIERASFSVLHGPGGSFVLMGAPEASEAAAASSGSTGLRGPNPLPTLPNVELLDARVTFIDRAIPGDHVPSTIELHRAELAHFAAGETATFSASGSVGENDARGSFDLSGRIGPLSSNTSLSDHPASLQLVAKGLDAGRVAPYLPVGWHIRSAEGRLDANVSLHGRLGGDLQGDLAFSFVPGAIDFAGMRFDGHSRIRKKMSRADGSLSFSDGEVEAERASFWGYPARKIRGNFAYHDETLELDPLRFEAYGGFWTHRGSVSLDSGTRFDLDSQVEALEIARLGAVVEKSEADEEASNAGPTLLGGNARVRGEWTGDENWLSPLEGSGRVELHGGEMPSEHLLAALGKAITAMVPKRSSRRGGSRQVSKTPLEHCTSSFRIEAGRLRTDDLELLTGDYRLTGKGSLGHDLTLELRTEVALSVTGINKMLEIAAVAGQREPKNPKLPPIPVRVTGTVQDPGFHTDLSGIPVATLGAFVWGVEGAAGLATGTMGAARSAAEGLIDIERRRGGNRAKEAPDGKP